MNDFYARVIAFTQAVLIVMLVVVYMRVKGVEKRQTQIFEIQEQISAFLRDGVCP
jgi:hypothetical protein